MGPETRWMYHSLNLAIERRNKLSEREGADLAFVNRLKYEVRMRLYVMDYLHQSTRFYGSALIWHRYMVEHARLQIQRYAREISEDEFHTRCRALRLERDAADLAAQGEPWLRSTELLTE